MSRLKRLREFEKNFATMTADELWAELIMRKEHAKYLNGIAKKGALKNIHEIEKAYRRKRDAD
jgi:hypothetical protein